MMVVMSAPVVLFSFPLQRIFDLVDVLQFALDQLGSLHSRLVLEPVPLLLPVLGHGMAVQHEVLDQESDIEDDTDGAQQAFDHVEGD